MVIFCLIQLIKQKMTIFVINFLLVLTVADPDGASHWFL